VGVEERQDARLVAGLAEELDFSDEAPISLLLSFRGIDHLEGDWARYSSACSAIDLRVAARAEFLVECPGADLFRLFSHDHQTRLQGGRSAHGYHFLPAQPSMLRE
jgi:hypothetical protein